MRTTMSRASVRVLREGFFPGNRGKGEGGGASSLVEGRNLGSEHGAYEGSVTLNLAKQGKSLGSPWHVCASSLSATCAE